MVHAFTVSLKQSTLPKKDDKTVCLRHAKHVICKLVGISKTRSLITTVPQVSNSVHRSLKCDTNPSSDTNPRSRISSGLFHPRDRNVATALRSLATNHALTSEPSVAAMAPIMSGHEARSMNKHGLTGNAHNASFSSPARGVRSASGCARQARWRISSIERELAWTYGLSCDRNARARHRRLFQSFPICRAQNSVYDGLLWRALTDFRNWIRSSHIPATSQRVCSP